MTADVLAEVAAERARQTAKHGDQSHLPDGTGPRMDALGDLVEWMEDRGAEPDNISLAAWAKARTKAASQNEGGDGSITFEHILTEEWAEAIAEDDPQLLRAELIQVAAVAVQWVQAIDRRQSPHRPCPKCDGCGRIATDDDGTPWTFWENLPVKSAAAVALGLVKPVTCPQCHGSGSVAA